MVTKVLYSSRILGPWQSNLTDYRVFGPTGSIKTLLCPYHHYFPPIDEDLTATIPSKSEKRIWMETLVQFSTTNIYGAPVCARHHARHRDTKMNKTVLNQEWQIHGIHAATSSFFPEAVINHHTASCWVCTWPQLLLNRQPLSISRRCWGGWNELALTPVSRRF